MSVQVLADTHALIWYLFDEERLSSAGRAALDGAIGAGFPILVSAISIIAATAVSLGVPLVTRDGKIRASSVHTIRA